MGSATTTTPTPANRAAFVSVAEACALEPSAVRSARRDEQLLLATREHQLLTVPPDGLDSFDEFWFHCFTPAAVPTLPKRDHLVEDIAYLHSHDPIPVGIDPRPSPPQPTEQIFDVSEYEVETDPDAPTPQRVRDERREIRAQERIQLLQDARILDEQALARKHAEEEKIRRELEAEEARLAAEAKRLAEEAKRKAEEEEESRRVAEAKRRAEEEERRKAEEEEARLAAEAKRLAEEEEARRVAEAKRIAEEDEAKRLAEEEERLREEEEAEAKRKAEEEERLKAEQETGEARKAEEAERAAEVERQAKEEERVRLEQEEAEQTKREAEEPERIRLANEEAQRTQLEVDENEAELRAEEEKRLRVAIKQALDAKVKEQRLRGKILQEISKDRPVPERRQTTWSRAAPTRGILRNRHSIAPAAPELPTNRDILTPSDVVDGLVDYDSEKSPRSRRESRQTRSASEQDDVLVHRSLSKKKRVSLARGTQLFAPLVDYPKTPATASAARLSTRASTSDTVRSAEEPLPSPVADENIRRRLVDDLEECGVGGAKLERIRRASMSAAPARTTEKGTLVRESLDSPELTSRPRSKSKNLVDCAVMCRGEEIDAEITIMFADFEVTTSDGVNVPPVVKPTEGIADVASAGDEDANVPMGEVEEEPQLTFVDQAVAVQTPGKTVTHEMKQSILQDNPSSALKENERLLDVIGEGDATARLIEIDEETGEEDKENIPSGSPMNSEKLDDEAPGSAHTTASTAKRVSILSPPGTSRSKTSRSTRAKATPAQSTTSHSEKSPKLVSSAKPPKSPASPSIAVSSMRNTRRSLRFNDLNSPEIIAEPSEHQPRSENPAASSSQFNDDAENITPNVQSTDDGDFVNFAHVNIVQNTQSPTPKPDSSRLRSRRMSTPGPSSSNPRPRRSSRISRTKDYSLTMNVAEFDIPPAEDRVAEEQEPEDLLQTPQIRSRGRPRRNTKSLDFAVNEKSKTFFRGRRTPRAPEQTEPPVRRSTRYRGAAASSSPPTTRRKSAASSSKGKRIPIDDHDDASIGHYDDDDIVPDVADNEPVFADEDDDPVPVDDVEEPIQVNEVVADDPFEGVVSEDDDDEPEVVQPEQESPVLSTRSSTRRKGGSKKSTSAADSVRTRKSARAAEPEESRLKRGRKRGRPAKASKQKLVEVDAAEERPSRRGKRARFPPLAYHLNEKVVYERRDSQVMPTIKSVRQLPQQNEVKKKGKGRRGRNAEPEEPDVEVEPEPEPFFPPDDPLSPEDEPEPATVRRSKRSGNSQKSSGASSETKKTSRTASKTQESMETRSSSRRTRSATAKASSSKVEEVEQPRKRRRRARK